MKKLILFRHGKSRWDMNVTDMKRDLLETGIERTKKSARTLSEYLDFEIDAWYSSPAVRAKRTADLTADFFSNPEIKTDEQLYTFSFFDLLKFIKNLDNSIETAIFFGHNEAYTEFVNRMGNQYIENLPTSGVAIFEFDTKDWKSIEKGKTLHIIKPKSLA